ncbi:MAG: DUF1573 domain-containing protein [Kiritimatiellae bacterium]|jgi:hypothetical protein|nr:DUF1573 domain-containing protein [Kiritimatiellia bacterium]
MSTSITPSIYVAPIYRILSVALTFFALSVSAKPSIFSQESEHDFGQKRTGEVVQHDFTLQNRGNTQLKIHKIQTSCGCTTMAAKTMELEPGEEKKLTVELNLSGRIGKQMQQVILHTNDPENRTYRLKMQGEAVPEIQVEPRTLNLQQTQPDEPHQGTVTLTSTTGKPFTIQKATANRDRLEIEIERAEDGLSSAVKVTPKPQDGQGHFTDVLEVETSNDSMSSIRILVMWQISTGISVAPGQLNLVTGQNEQAIDRYLMVRGYEGLEKPLEVTKVEWPGRDVDITWQDTQRFGWRIHLKSFVPDPDMHGEEILIHTNAEGFETLRIPVRVVK